MFRHAAQVKQSGASRRSIIGMIKHELLTTSTGRLMLAVLGGLADVERDLIRPDRRRQKPRQGPRKAHEQAPFPDTGPTERGHQTPLAGRYIAGIGRQLTTAASPQCAAPPPEPHDHRAPPTRLELVCTPCGCRRLQMVADWIHDKPR
jgi:hypothetical protein